jgi:hypothetical protein
VQVPSGELNRRVKGTPQGGVVSPVLSNLFLHYVFDKWLQNHYPDTVWCRYNLKVIYALEGTSADDGLVHCRSEAEAQYMLEALKQRFQSCGLELHPVKTKIVYCKDGSRKGPYEHSSFDFLGYTFRRRLCRNRKRNSVFVNFTPAVSLAAMKSMRRKIRTLRVRMCTELSLAQLAKWLNPIISGWIAYYGCYCRSALYGMCRHVNMTLVRRARRKFKTLRHHKTRAMLFLEKIADQCSDLFAHWRVGMVGTFA